MNVVSIGIKPVLTVALTMLVASVFLLGCQPDYQAKPNANGSKDFTGSLTAEGDIPYVSNNPNTPDHNQEIVKDPYNPTPEEQKNLDFSESIVRVQLQTLALSGKRTRNNPTGYRIILMLKEYEDENNKAGGKRVSLELKGAITKTGQTAELEKSSAKSKYIYVLRGTCADSHCQDETTLRLQRLNLKTQQLEGIAIVDSQSYWAKVSFKTNKSQMENINSYTTQTQDRLAALQQANRARVTSWSTARGTADDEVDIFNDRGELQYSFTTPSIETKENDAVATVINHNTKRPEKKPDTIALTGNGDSQLYRIEIFDDGNNDEEVVESNVDNQAVEQELKNKEREVKEQEAREKEAEEQKAKREKKAREKMVERRQQERQQEEKRALEMTMKLTPEKAEPPVTRPKTPKQDNKPPVVVHDEITSSPDGLRGTGKHSYFNVPYGAQTNPRITSIVDDLESNYHLKGVQYWISVFSDKKSKYFKKGKYNRLNYFYRYAHPVRTAIEGIYHYFGVPAVLSYNMVIESNYFYPTKKKGAYHPVRALKPKKGKHSTAFGPNMLVKGTATWMGVKVSSSPYSASDERSYLAPSVCGAARYMSYLQKNKFRNRDATLAVMAYYLGGGGANTQAKKAKQRVLRCVRNATNSSKQQACTENVFDSENKSKRFLPKQKNQLVKFLENYDFSYRELAETNSIKKDAVNYVNEFLAIYFISGDPASYGFTVDTSIGNFPRRKLYPGSSASGISGKECRQAASQIRI